MREIVLDTETTGIDPAKGHKIIEIGCVELYNLLPTGNVFHKYIKPNRNIDQDSYRIHGLSDAFLADKPIFADIAEDFLDFIKSDPLIIHNAGFDKKFLDYEINYIKRPLIKNQLIDTMKLAAKQFPGASISLDALCKRFSINIEQRKKHGALIDSQLLASVYLELKGGSQASILQDHACDNQNKNIIQEEAKNTQKQKTKSYDIEKVITPDIEEKKLHQQYINTITNSIWNKYKEIVE